MALESTLRTCSGVVFLVIAASCSRSNCRLPQPPYTDSRLCISTATLLPAPPPLLQVVIAVDDSKSMADSGCGGFALEALTLMCRAMARLEVGELGVVRFGGPAGVVPLQVA